MNMNTLNAFAIINWQTNDFPKRPQSSVIDKILQLPSECQKNKMKIYFYDNHVAMFRYDGWGNIQPIP